jgi:hypothetical protein
MGCPRPRLLAGEGIGRRSTSLTNVTSNESCSTIRLPPIFVACDYHNDRGRISLGQAPSEGLLFMIRPQLGRNVLSRSNYSQQKARRFSHLGNPLWLPASSHALLHAGHLRTAGDHQHLVMSVREQS